LPARAACPAEVILRSGGLARRPGRWLGFVIGCIQGALELFEEVPDEIETGHSILHAIRRGVSGRLADIEQ
jgi:hypothetical protein